MKKNRRISRKKNNKINWKLVVGALFIILLIGGISFSTISLETVWELKVQLHQVGIKKTDSETWDIYNAKNVPPPYQAWPLKEFIQDPDGDLEYSTSDVLPSPDVINTHTLPTIKIAINNLVHVDQDGNKIKDYTKPSESITLDNGTVINVYYYQFDLTVRVYQADFKVGLKIGGSGGYTTMDWLESATADVSVYIALKLDKKLSNSNVSADYAGAWIVKVDNHIVGMNETSYKEFLAEVKKTWDTRSITPYLSSPQEGQAVNAFTQGGLEHQLHVLQFSFELRAGFQYVASYFAWFETGHTYNVYYPESIVTVRYKIVTKHPPVISSDNSTIQPSNDINPRLDSHDPVSEGLNSIGQALYGAGAFFANPQNQQWLLIMLGGLIVLVILIKLPALRKRR